MFYCCPSIYALSLINFCDTIKSFFIKKILELIIVDSSFTLKKRNKCWKWFPFCFQMSGLLVVSGNRMPRVHWYHGPLQIKNIETNFFILLFSIRVLHVWLYNLFYLIVFLFNYYSHKNKHEIRTLKWKCCMIKVTN